MVSVIKMKAAYNLFNSSDKIIRGERDYIYFYDAVRFITIKITKGYGLSSNFSFSINRFSRSLINSLKLETARLTFGI